MKTLEELQDEIGIWGDVTFPQSTRQSILSHFVEEVAEFQHACKPILPDYPNAGEEFEELADCFILLIQFAHKSGISLADAVEAKMTINRARTWNSEPEPAGHWKHVREEVTR